MKSIFVILVMFLTLGITSCTPMEEQETEQNQVVAGDPPSEETGEEGELVPNE